MGRRLGILGFAVGAAALAGVLLYGAFAALQGNDQTAPASSQSPRPQVSSGGWAEENVREVQTKLRDAGLYFGEIDGAYSSELAAALGRYQIRNALPITGQLDVETSKALGAKPAVATSAASHEQSSETWRRLRTGDRPMIANNNTQVAASPGAEKAAEMASEMPPPSAPGATSTIQPEAQAVGSPSSENWTTNVSTERLRDYVGAFVLAGLDPHVGSEADFFSDRVQYYDQGVMDREKIRKDLQRYAARWPDRQFSLAGDIAVEPHGANSVRVTFPLRYELRNGAKHSSGKVEKTLVLERVGDDLLVAAVNERKIK